MPKQSRGGYVKKKFKIFSSISTKLVTEKLPFFLAGKARRGSTFLKISNFTENMERGDDTNYR